MAELTPYDLKLGKGPATRFHALADLDTYLQGKPPQPPGVVRPPIVNWGMLGNDTLGDCVEAGSAHAIMAMNKLLGTRDFEPNTAQVRGQYFHETGGADVGLNVSTHLLLWHRTGIFGNPYAPAGQKPNKLPAFANLPLNSPIALQRGIYLYGVINLGIQVPLSMQEQFARGQEITVVRNSPIEGGHDILGVGYSDAGMEIVSWGRTVLMSWPFLSTYMDEADVLLSQESLEAGHGPGPDLDEKSLLADINSLSR